MLPEKEQHKACKTAPYHPSLNGCAECVQRGNKKTREWSLEKKWSRSLTQYMRGYAGQKWIPAALVDTLQYLGE